MTKLLLIALGGAMGSLLRYGIATIFLAYSLEGKFPTGTFIINMIGCLAIGILSGLAAKQGWFSLETRLFLFFGLLGGFTTYSTFGLETFYLLRRGDFVLAGSYVVGSFVFGLVLVWLGYSLISQKI